jgi:hypothetical protein
MMAKTLDGLWHTWGMAKPLDTRRPGDLNQLAADLVDAATNEDALESVDDGNDLAAVALGRKGGKKGGPAPAAALTPERRKWIAQKTVAERWAKSDHAPNG